MNDVDFNHPELNGLAYEDLQGLLDGIPARKKLLLLDACNSGENEKSDNNGLSNSKDLAIKQGAKGIEIESVSDSSQNQKNSFETMMELFVNINNQTGATVVSAAGGKQSALEGGAVYINGKPISNGAFTYSILEYLTEHQDDKNKLTVNQLKQYAEQRVTEITEGKQKPTSRQDPQMVSTNTFKIGTVNEEVRNAIHLPDEKPIFTKSEFRNTALRLDNLKLRNIVDNEISDISERGENNDILFSSDYKGADVYTIAGDYTVKDKSIEVSVFLIKGGSEALFNHTIKGSIDNLKKLCEEIVESISNDLKNQKK